MAKAQKEQKENLGIMAKKSNSKSQKAGLTLPVPRVNKYVKKHSGLKRTGGTSAVFMTAALEYTLGEILELAGNKTKAASRKTINNEDFTAAIRHDVDLARLFSDTAVSLGEKLTKVSEAIKYVPAKPKKSQAGDAEDA